MHRCGAEDSSALGLGPRGPERAQHFGVAKRPLCVVNRQWVVSRSFRVRGQSAPLTFPSPDRLRIVPLLLSPSFALPVAAPSFSGHHAAVESSDISSLGARARAALPSWPSAIGRHSSEPARALDIYHSSTWRPKPQVAFHLCLFILIVRSCPADSYQLVSFILGFKGTQVLSSGVAYAIIAACKFWDCIHSDMTHSCNVAGPGVDMDSGSARASCQPQRLQIDFSSTQHRHHAVPNSTPDRRGSHTPTPRPDRSPPPTRAIHRHRIDRTPTPDRPQIGHIKHNTGSIPIPG